MSTTVDWIVAVRFGQSGLVVDILREEISLPLVDCSFWSDFTEEDERFFIGSLQTFTFKTIHHLSLKQNYAKYIRAIGILMKMIRGYPYRVSAIKEKDVTVLSDLTSEQITQSRKQDIPLYVHHLFKYIAQNVKKVEMNL